MKIALNNKFSEKRILSILSKIQKVYFVFACLAFICILVSMFNVSAVFTKQDSLHFFIAFAISLFVYLGMKFRKGWLIPLVLVVSIYQLYCNFIKPLKHQTPVW
ncbi:hypothetical protein MNBD_DELTA01-1234 [hydrothermal vent metagenome]|uniref:Uncharacterized protein n=1 Tax=hydrothermal vent metagenome TaxID=652676 RepID=A0A3B0R9K4_9ZZZZ